MSEQEMLDLASKFAPYRYVYIFRPPISAFLCHILTAQQTDSTAYAHRSLFMWYMWRIEDVDISVLQQ
jgi:hypothetical protein